MAYVFGSSTEWLRGVAPAASDKFIMLAAINLVGCIAHAGLPLSAHPTPRTKAKRRRSTQ